MKEIVAFDFDGTLIGGDSFGGFARFARGRMGWYRALIKNFFSLAGWKLGRVDADLAKERLFSTLFRGMPAATYRRLGEEYLPFLEKMDLPLTLGELREAQRRGAEVAIVSASVGDWLRPWADKKGIPTVISTEVEVDADGRLTGRFSTPNCSGQEKVRRLKQRFPRRNLYRLTAYGDSSGDDEMLREADKGVLLYPRTGRVKSTMLNRIN